jgi:hypothetical protein
MVMVCELCENEDASLANISGASRFSISTGTSANPFAGGGLLLSVMFVDPYGKVELYHGTDLSTLAREAD